MIARFQSKLWGFYFAYIELIVIEMTNDSRSYMRESALYRGTAATSPLQMQKERVQ